MYSIGAMPANGFWFANLRTPSPAFNMLRRLLDILSLAKGVYCYLKAPLGSFWFIVQSLSDKFAKIDLIVKINKTYHCDNVLGSK